MGYYFGKSTYKLDSGYFDQEGHVKFSGNDLHEGIFFLILDNKSYFNFLIGEDKQFKITGHLPDLIDGMKVTGSGITGDYIAYQQKLNKEESLRAKASEVFLKTRSRDSVELYQHKIEILKEQNQVFRKFLIQKHEANYLGTYLKALDFPEKSRNPGQDLHAIRNKLFQNVVFSDPRLLYAPVFFEKIDLYFTRIVPDNTSVIKKEIDWLIQESKVSLPVHQFIMQYLLENYSPSKGYPYWPVFVYLVNDVLAKEKNNWLSTDRLFALKKEAKNIQDLLPGNTAPDLLLENWKGKKQSLHGINAENIILYFWDPWCTHCREITSYLKNIDNGSPPEKFEIYAVYTGLSKSLWKEYVEREKLNWVHVYDPLMNSDYSRIYRIDTTPMVYLLDGGMHVRGRFKNIGDLKKFIASTNK
jgi:thiol-disulfide isomerase/thioredoxin